MSRLHAAAAKRGGWLDRIERVGNALPDPTTLFLLGTLGVLVLSQLAVALDWSVEKTLAVTDPATGAVTGALERVPVRPVGTASYPLWASRSSRTHSASTPTTLPTPPATHTGTARVSSRSSSRSASVSSPQRIAASMPSSSR